MTHFCYSYLLGMLAVSTNGLGRQAEATTWPILKSTTKDTFTSASLIGELPVLLHPLSLDYNTSTERMSEEACHLLR